MKKEQFVEEMIARGWVQDKWGHLRKDLTYKASDGEKRKVKGRVKMLKTSLRVERESLHDNVDGWFLITRSYFKDIVMDGDTVVVGAVRFRSVNRHETA